jgi:PAS domain S-box-containing protein
MFRRRKREEESAPELDNGSLRGVLDDHRRVEEVVGEVGGGYWDMIENSPSMIQSVNPDGKYFYVNRAWRDELGYSIEEARGLSFLEVVHPDYHEHCTLVFSDILSGKSHAGVECDFVCKDGSVVHVRGNVSCRFEEGKPVATRGVFRLADEPLPESEAVGDFEGGIGMEEAFLAFQDLRET